MHPRWPRWPLRHRGCGLRLPMLMSTPALRCLRLSRASSALADVNSSASMFAMARVSSALADVNSSASDVCDADVA